MNLSVLPPSLRGRRVATHATTLGIPKCGCRIREAAEQSEQSDAAADDLPDGAAARAARAEALRLRARAFRWLNRPAEAARDVAAAVAIESSCARARAARVVGADALLAGASGVASPVARRVLGAALGTFVHCTLGLAERLVLRTPRLAAMLVARSPLATRLPIPWRTRANSFVRQPRK